MMESYLIVILISAVPWIELRGSIPVGVLLLGMNPAEALLISFLGNLAVIPMVYFSLEFLYSYFERFSFVRRPIEWFRKRWKKKLDKGMGFVGLCAFVAVPLPGTGAWTGTLVAWLFKLNRKKALLAIALGVVIAGVLVTGITIALGEAAFRWLGVPAGTKVI